MKRLWILGLCAIGLGLSVVGVRAWAIGKVNTTLSAQGISWQTHRTAPLAAHWEGLSSPLGTADKLSIRGTWPITVQVEGPEIDLAQWMDRPQGSTDAATGVGIPSEVSVKNMTVRWKDKVLMRELSGPIKPVPDLVGPDCSLRLEASSSGERIAVGTASIALELPNLKGTAAVSLRAAETIEASVDMPDAVLSHPMIAAEPLASQPLKMRGSWSRTDHTISLTGTLGNVDFSAQGTATFAPLKTQLSLSIADARLADVVSIFGTAIPEAKKARMDGDLGMVAKVTGPPWQLDPTPSATNLSVMGALGPRFKRAMIQWQTKDSNGLPVIKQTGPAHPDWTPLAQAGWMPLTVVASEDGSFHTHPGYDMGAIRQAISQARAGERLRGGSTLTQQLAKNLFLSGERTLVRKLRELLLALELESTLSKPAILALYLNVVEFGPGIHGIDAAADAYFLKAPDTLTLTEAAWLASVLPGPRAAHSRARASKARRARVNTILDRMAARGTISAAQRDQARAAPLRFVVE